MVFHYKPSILGYPYVWQHPYQSRDAQQEKSMKQIFRNFMMWSPIFARVFVVLKIRALFFVVPVFVQETTHGTCLIILILVTLAGVGRGVRKDVL